MKTTLVCSAALFLALTVNAQPDIEWETIIPVPAHASQNPLSVEVCDNGDIVFAYATSADDGSLLRIHRYDLDGNPVETVSWGTEIKNATCTPTLDGGIFVAGTAGVPQHGFDAKFIPGTPQPLWYRNSDTSLSPRDLHEKADGGFFFHGLGTNLLSEVDRFGVNPQTYEYVHETWGHNAYPEDIEQLNDGSYLTCGWHTNDMNWSVYYVWFLEDGTQLNYNSSLTGAFHKSFATEQLMDGTLMTVGDTYIEGGFNDPSDYGVYVMRTTQGGDALWTYTVGDWQDNYIRRAFDVAIQSHAGDESAVWIVGENQPVNSNTQQAYITRFTLTSQQTEELFPGPGVLTSIKRTIDGGFICLGMTPDNEPWLVKLYPLLGNEPLHLSARLEKRYSLPPQGGQVRFDMLVSNALDESENRSLRLDVELPGGDIVTVDNVPWTFEPGQPLRLNSRALQVPGGAPAGEYTMTLTLQNGTFTQSKAVLTFTKTGAASGPAQLSGTLLGDQPEPVVADAALPGEYALNAVYPNPFNAATTIHVTLPATAELNVTIYNITGQQVATVANSTFNAGEHRLTFDASTLASGLYFVRAEVPGELNAVQKVMLVR
ncbi:T9SS type A sorting domain-containing protein [bacterium]|nr:T9SS type A sorting domain-containing protein [bacterium]